MDQASSLRPSEVLRLLQVVLTAAVTAMMWTERDGCFFCGWVSAHQTLTGPPHIAACPGLATLRALEHLGQQEDLRAELEDLRAENAVLSGRVPCPLCGGKGRAVAVDAVYADGSVENPRPAPCMVCATPALIQAHAEIDRLRAALVQAHADGDQLRAQQVETEAMLAEIDRLEARVTAAVAQCDRALGTRSQHPRHASLRSTDQGPERRRRSCAWLEPDLCTAGRPVGVSCTAQTALALGMAIDYVQDLPVDRGTKVAAKQVAYAVGDAQRRRARPGAVITFHTQAGPLRIVMKVLPQVQVQWKLAGCAPWLQEALADFIGSIR